VRKCEVPELAAALKIPVDELLWDSYPLHVMFERTRRSLRMCTQMLFRFLLLGCCVAFAFEDPSVIIKSAVGEATVQNGGKGNWKPAHVGTKLKQGDRIRTSDESEVLIEFTDGSMVTVGENSEAGIKLLLQADSTRNTTLELAIGKLSFSIQKLVGAKSSFEFEMKSATAAIRGTDGEVETNGEESVASLETGRLEMIAKTGHTDINAGQLVLHQKSGFQVMTRPTDPQEFHDLVKKLLKREKNKRDELRERNRETRGDSSMSVRPAARESEHKAIQRQIQERKDHEQDHNPR